MACLSTLTLGRLFCLPAPQLPHVDHKLAFAMGACHLPLQGLNHVLLELVTSNTPKEFSKGLLSISHLLAECSDDSL